MTNSTEGLPEYKPVHGPHLNPASAPGDDEPDQTTIPVRFQNEVEYANFYRSCSTAQYQALLRMRDHDHFLARVEFSSLPYLCREDSEAEKEKERRHASIMVLISRLVTEGVQLKLEGGV